MANQAINELITEIKTVKADPYLVITALLNALDQGTEMELDYFYDVLNQGNFKWPDEE